MTRAAQRRTVKAAREPADAGTLHRRGIEPYQEAGTAMSIETIVIIVVIVLLVLFVLGYVGRGRRA